MSGSAIDTVCLHRLLDRMQAGDLAAREELFRGFYARLEQLTRQMLRSYPGLRRWEDTGDVLHPALLRLMRALDEVRPASTRAFFGLAVLQIRRNLLNLVERHKAEYALKTPAGGSTNAVGTRILAEVPSAADEANDLEKWEAFHRGVDTLPDSEREVVGLVFYSGLSKEQSAELLGVSRRTVMRRWRLAMTRLHALVNLKA